MFGISIARVLCSITVPAIVMAIMERIYPKVGQIGQPLCILYGMIFTGVILHWPWIKSKLVKRNNYD